MSIRVKDVTKLYGEQKALDQVSFTIDSGEIVGFLGPNGAGKSTMMKIITCYLQPNTGEVDVCGLNIFDNPLEVKRQIGYLPEHNPLYLDLYVKEYLEFVAGIHKVPNVKARISEIIGLTGLEIEQRKKIGALSKGYRQRVGLAQALIHDPKVLILDEPTSGLDPNQLVEIRELIRSIGKEKTVVLSTHIMQEVEALCSRVLIIKQGKIVADDGIKAISEQQDKEQVLLVEFSQPISVSQLLNHKEITSAEPFGKLYKITSKSLVDIRPLVFNFAVASGNMVLSMKEVETTLEATFQKLTKDK